MKTNLKTRLLLLIAIVSIVSCRKEQDQQLSAEAMAAAEGAEGRISAEASAAAAINTYYVSPSGNDNNNGSIGAPFFTLQKAWTVIAAGDLIYMRGGTYTYSAQQGLTGKNGTAANPIMVFAYPGETPVITRGSTFSRNYWHRSGVFFTGNYFHWKGIEMKGFANIDGKIEDAMLAYNSNNNIFELLNIHDNHAGFYLEGVSDNNLFLNCDFHDNYDVESGGGNSDGLAAGYMNSTTTNTTIRGCRSWNNGDDGFDTYENLGSVTFENCWSWHNGYVKGTSTAAGNGVGFKLGSDNTSPTSLVGIVKRRIQNSLAFDNRNRGMHINGANYTTEIYNNTFYKNGIGGLNFHHNNRVHNFRNNVAFDNDEVDVEVSSASSNITNSTGVSTGGNDGNWTQNVTAADFVSVNSAGVAGARQADGSLPVLNFLKLASTSALINTGTNVGLPYAGSAPDRGAFESGTTTTPPTNIAPVANAGADKAITLPVNTISLVGTGSDVDGTVTAYAWTLRSGPNTPALGGTTTTTLAASNLVAGTYVFRLTVTDNGTATGYDEVNVIVGSSAALPPAPNQINVSSAVAATGFMYYVVQNFGTSPDISTNTTQSKLRIFENGVELTPPHSSHSDIQTIGRGRFSHWGDGSFVALYFSTSDNSNPKTNGRTYTYSIGTTTPVNQAPVANAGADKSITLPTNTIILTGSGTDADGTVASYAWTLRSGPNTPVLAGATTTRFTVKSMVAGTYVFRLTVKDNLGLTGYDEVTVVVKPAAKVINTSSAKLASGFNYYVVQDFGTLPDITGNPTRSTLRIYENGIELKPPHSSHNDIATLGRGRFSHWGDGSFVALYFSASDNTNPKTNGRTYTYTIQ